MSNSILKSHLDEIWQKTLDLVEQAKYVDESVFNMWLKDSSLNDVQDQLATIVVPYTINRSVFLDMLTVFEENLSTVIGFTVKCQVLLKDDVASFEKSKIPQPIVFDDKINKDYTFDSFVEGQNNRESFAAAKAVAQMPGTFFNPLFIFGNSGLGKTHLLHSIGNVVKETRPNDKLLYIYSEDFIQLIVTAIKNKTIEEVKQKISELDFLLLDDIQRLAQFNQSNEIFFTLYNNLIANKKQIVITSDIHPQELKGVETRLISRFVQGLTVAVGSPEFETALAILVKKLEGREQEKEMIDEDVLHFIATKFSSDVRRLEGALNELLFKSILYNPVRINLEFAAEVFKEDPIVRTGEEITVEKIKKSVCEFYGLTKAQLESKSRTANIANARHIAVYLCRTHLEMPFAKIGIEFGNRDHSTIMSSYEKITVMLEEKEVFRQAVSKIENSLGIK